MTHENALFLWNDTTTRWCWSVSFFVFLLIVTSPTAAWSDVPVVYHSPNDDGIPLAAPFDVVPGSSHTLYLYIDGGSDGSTEIRCATGTGDETCFWNVLLQGAASVTITGFTPNTGIVHYLDPSGVTIGINGGDPWRGDLGPRRIGEMLIDGGAYGGALELVSGQSVNSSLGVDALVSTNIVPEPATGLSLGFGGMLLAGMGRRRGRALRRAGIGGVHEARRVRFRRHGTVALFFALTFVMLAPLAHAQVSTDCGDVVADGTIDAADLDALRRFLAGDPAAPDLQGDAPGLARCDVTGDGICGVRDYVRIRRYMIDLTGGLNETCPLAGGAYPPVVLAPPVVDQPSTISTDRSSVLLTGTAEPGELIRIEGAVGLPEAAAGADGQWEVEVPLALDTLSTLDVRRDFGGGYLSEVVQLSVTQTNASGLGVLEGIVVDESSADTVLEGATVSLHGVSTTTNRYGRFRLDGLSEGRMILRVELEGYVPSALSAETNSLESSEASPDVRVSLVPMTATQTVGSAGGTITTPLGFELIVPAGSLSSDTEIALTELVGTETTLFGGLPTVDIGPGPIVFDPPAILRFPFSGFSPGALADFVQVDQSAAAVEPRVGSADAGGVLQLEVSSSAGDGVPPKVWADFREANYILGEDYIENEGKPQIRNCRSGTPKEVSLIPKARSTGFEGLTGGVSPALRARLEAHPPAPDFEGLEDYGDTIQRFDVSAPAFDVTVPPGKIRLLKTVERVYPIRQPLYLIRVPDGGGDWSKNRIGTLRYEIAFVMSWETAALVDCPKRTAGAWGDPHLIRFDHVGQALPQSSGNGRFDFQGAGEFVLFESTTDGMIVQARMVPANGSTTVMNALAMDVDGDRVSIYSAPTLDVRIEGVATPLMVGVPETLPGGGELERETTAAGKDQVTVRWSDGSELKVSEWSTSLSYLNVFPRLGPSRFAEVQGLLGNANGVIGDDLNLRDGTPSTPADLYTTFADSWRISQAESLFDYEPGEDTSTYNGTPADPDYTIADLDPVAVAAAEADCIAAGIVDDPGLSECIIDVVVFSDSSATGPAAEAQAELPDTGITVTIPATSNIFGAGLSSVPNFGAGGTGNGTLPPGVGLPTGTGRTIRLLDAAGGIRFFPAENPTCPPDGKPVAETSWGTWGGLTGPITERRCALAFVFLSDDARPPTAPPAYDSGDLSDAYIAPEIGQIFQVGDGLTPAGEVQLIFVPDGATRVFLGELARFNDANPEPGWYGDNTGTHEVIFEVVVPDE